MEEQKVVEEQVEEVSQPTSEKPQEVKLEELSPEKIKEIQGKLQTVLDEEKVTIEIMPTYNLIIKPKK